MSPDPVPSASSRPTSDWRWLPWLAVFLVGVALITMVVSEPAWRLADQILGWMLRPIFHDWHVIRLGCYAADAGIDPLAATDHPFNYPRVILLGRLIGLHHIPAEVMGLVAAAGFLGVAGWLLRPRARWAAGLGAVLIVSPPVLLILERGNLDAWAFMLVAVGMATLARARSPVRAFGGCAAVVSAALLKLYPVVALLGGALGWRGRRRWWAVAGAAVFVTLTLIRFDEVSLVLRKTTRGIEPAYGYAIAVSRYHHDVVRVQHAEAAARQFIGKAMAASVGLYGLVVAGSALAGWRGRRRLVTRTCAVRDRALFWSGALIYVGTFGLGTNWSYRLVFLLLCVPALCAAVSERTTRRWALATLACLALTMLTPFHLPLGWFFASQAVHWGLVALLTAGAAAVLTGAQPLNQSGPTGTSAEAQ